MVNLHKQRVEVSNLRIIGGNLRSRLITFPSVHGLRPTPNRVRETLFNWLAPKIDGANCLDLFAGSGALSFEAMSRGAAYCLLLDSNDLVVKFLNENKIKLNISAMDIFQASFPYLFDILSNKRFDIVFLDPPFHDDLLQPAFDWLLSSDCLKDKALIYIESESATNALSLLPCFELMKDKKAGNVRYSLIQYHA